MTESYKNVLANQFMRDTNYIIIKDTDDLEELERQWELFNTQLTNRQKRLSDDRSIEIWNMTNQDHYEVLKLSLMKDLDSKFDDSKEELISYSYEDDVQDDEITNYSIDMDFDELPDDDNEITDPIKEENEIPSETTDEKEPEWITGEWYKFISRTEDKDKQADQYEIDQNINIIGGIKGNKPEEYLSNLEKAWSDFNHQSHDHRKKSDDKCREIYGIDNITRYNQLKAETLRRIEQKPTEPAKSIETKKEEISEEDKPIEEYGEFVTSVYNDMILEQEEVGPKSKKRRFNDCPYFTPSELIDLGVHQNHNYYSPEPDNDGLITNVKTATWFDSYKDMCLDHIFEDYTKDWIDTLDVLYSDFDDIKASGDEAKILARKQSILDLGWNPEITFNRKNRKLASKRVNDILDRTVPRDIFINLDDIEESDDVVEETVTSSTHQPVFLLFTSGKTPVISSSIKAVTKSIYSHASIGFDSSLRKDLYSYNMKNGKGLLGGLVHETIDNAKDNIVSVMCFFVPNNVVSNMKETIADYENKHTTYDFGILFNKIAHVDIKVTNKYHQVCSTFVDTVLRSNNAKVTDDAIPSPGQLYNSAKTQPNKIIEVYNGPATKYDGKKVDRKLKTLLAKSKLNSIEESTSIKYNEVKATKNDLDYVLKCRYASTIEYCDNKEEVKKYIDEDTPKLLPHCIIIKYNNNPIGMYCLYSTPDGMYLGEMYIEKEYRNNGIGTDIINKLSSKHKSKLYLYVSKDNTKASSLYKNLGFEVEDDSNDSYNVMRYNKSLKESVSFNEGLFENKKTDKYSSELAKSVIDDTCTFLKKYVTSSKFKKDYSSYYFFKYFSQSSIKAMNYGDYGSVEICDESPYQDDEIDNYPEEVYNKFTKCYSEVMDAGVDYIKKTYSDQLKDSYIVINTGDGDECNIYFNKDTKSESKYFIETVSDLDSAESNDYYHNIDLWESGKSNLIWVTGMSGSGKSTISKEINKSYTDTVYVELDNIQRAKMENWNDLKNEVLNAYIDSLPNGMQDVFPYCNTLDKVTWGDIVSPENQCHIEFNRLFEFIIKYANSHKNKRFVVEGVQIAYCTTNQMIGKISKYPVIVKMNGPLKTEIRREKRTFNTGLERGDNLVGIFKHISKQVKNFAKNKFYLSNYKDLKYFKNHLTEDADILNEVKKFPIEFDKDGNLIIYKSRTGSLSFGDEVDDSVQLLESYRNTNNIEGMKYELAKLWYINDCIENQLKKRLTNDKYKELIDTRATCLNVFKYNLDYVMKAEKGFNFSDYYNGTPFSDNSVKITANTLKYSAQAFRTMIGL